MKLYTNKQSKNSKRWTSRFVLFGLFIAAGFIASAVNRLRSRAAENVSGRRLVKAPLTNMTTMKDRADYPCGAFNQQEKDGSWTLYYSEYPQDPFTAKECDDGAIILHIFGLFYMFLGLSIICDEFFVPALEEMTFSRLKLDADVAGATFMAAGGSAPELATSFIGSFTGSSVGFGTIVGSAVFNVLFVIGACAMASKEVLSLTSYPLARDATWYTLSLGLLAYFFANAPTDPSYVTEDGPSKYIELWEALIQFILYIGYVLIMWKNVQLKKWFYSTFYKNGSPVDDDKDKGSEKDIEMMSKNPLTNDDSGDNNETCSSVRTRGKFNAGIFRLMTAQTNWEEKLAYFAVQNIKGSMRETFDKLDEEKNGKIETQNVQHMLEAMGLKPSDEQVAKYMNELDTDKSGDISYDEFSAWYLKGEARVEAELAVEFAELDTNGDGVLDVSELRVLMDQIGPDLNSEEASIARAQKIVDELDLDRNGKISKDEFCGYYRTNKEFLEHKKQEQQEELEMAANNEEDVDMLAWPADADAKGKLMYVIALPLVFLFCCTIPDVRKEGTLFGKPFKDFYLYSFTMSIAMVGGLSYIMVWLAVTIGKQWGIPDEIMGLTFLAAGTSVPDLLTSVLVAMQGQGDMAVSSSIGSNIFDVTVGLPLPWIVYTAVIGKPFPVVADGVGTSIVILIVMLVAVISSIAGYGWKMTKALGYTMFVLYIVFVVQDLLRNKTLGWWPAFQVINF